MQNLKHLFLILFVLFSCRAAIAQDYFLDRFYSDDGVDQIQFYYNATTCWNPTILFPTPAEKLMTLSTHFITTNAAM